MNEIEKMLKDIVYGSVGAVATVLENAGEMTKAFVEKGQKVVAEGQTVAEKLGQQVKDACENAMKSTGVDISRLTREQRDELLSRLKEMADAEDAATIVEDVVNEIKDAVMGRAASEEKDDGIEYEAAPEEETPAEDAPEADDASDASEDEEANG